MFVIHFIFIYYGHMPCNFKIYDRRHLNVFWREDIIVNQLNHDRCVNVSADSPSFKVKHPAMNYFKMFAGKVYIDRFSIDF